MLFKKSKYQFSKNFWLEDHYKNFERIKNIYKGKDNLKFIEIGVYEGRTTIWMLENILIGTNCKIVCIDPNITTKGKKNLSYFIDKIIFYNRPSFYVLIDFLYNQENKFDFIYIDGDHHAPIVLQDIILSWYLLKIDGILLIDDYEMKLLDPYFYISHKEFKKYPKMNFIHPKEAVDSFLSLYRGQYEIIIDNYQIGLKKLLDIDY